jgi:hypothetical protein
MYFGMCACLCLRLCVCVCLRRLCARVCININAKFHTNICIITLQNKIQNVTKNKCSMRTLHLSRMPHPLISKSLTSISNFYIGFFIGLLTVGPWICSSLLWNDRAVAFAGWYRGCFSRSSTESAAHIRGDYVSTGVATSRKNIGPPHSNRILHRYLYK